MLNYNYAKFDLIVRLTRTVSFDTISRRLSSHLVLPFMQIDNRKKSPCGAFFYLSQNMQKDEFVQSFLYFRPTHSHLFLPTQQLSTIYKMRDKMQVAKHQARISILNNLREISSRNISIQLPTTTLNMLLNPLSYIPHLQVVS